MGITTARLNLRHWRKGNPDDAKSLYRFASDPEIGPRCGWMPHESIHDSEEILDTVFQSSENYAITLKERYTLDAHNRAQPQADVDTQENEQWRQTQTIANNIPIGSIALKPTGQHDHVTSAVREALDANQLNPGIDEDEIRRLLGNSSHSLVLGYWIGRPFWGQGMMTEALDALLDHAFNDAELGAQAVWGAHYVENIGSGKVMDHCGLKPVCRKKADYFNGIDEYHDCVLRVVTYEEWKSRNTKTA